MKKMILAALVAVASISANAQVWVGGSLGFNYNKNADDVKTTTFSIAPEVGYTLSDKWDIAIALEETNISQKDGDSMNTFAVNPYARYTFFQTGKVGFFLDMGFNVATSNGIYAGGIVRELDDNTTEFGIGVRPGVKFAASDKVTFVASLGQLGYRQIKNGDAKDNTFGLNVDGSALKFGVYYAF